jgi:hypothetical protein
LIPEEGIVLVVGGGGLEERFDAVEVKFARIDG